MPRKYDGTVARIAGNLLSQITTDYARIGATGVVNETVVRGAVTVARAIVNETERTEPPEPVLAKEKVLEEVKK